MSATIIIALGLIVAAGAVAMGALALRRRAARQSAQALRAALQTVQSPASATLQGWTGVWIIGVRPDDARDLRANLQLVTDSAESPAVLARALVGARGAELIHHVQGPVFESVDQGASWIEAVGPRLAAADLKKMSGSGRRELFGLAYLGPRAFTERAGMQDVAGYVGELSGASLVAYRESRARPWFPNLPYVTAGVLVLAGAAIAVTNTVCSGPAGNGEGAPAQDASPPTAPLFAAPEGHRPPRRSPAADAGASREVERAEGHAHPKNDSKQGASPPDAAAHREGDAPARRDAFAPDEGRRS